MPASLPVLPRIGHRLAAVVGLLLLLLGPVAAQQARPPAPPPPPPQSFAKPEEAVASLVAALGDDSLGKLRAIFGKDGERIIASGDPDADRIARQAFLKFYAEFHALEPRGDDRNVLVIGADHWPFPVPLVRAGAAWHFDAAAGQEELVNRRIGRNELMTIRTLLAMVEAQKDYFDRVQRGAGAGRFAQRFASTAGTHDGLYWDAAAGEAESPLAPLVDQARDEGYPGARSRDGRPLPYHGYLFRILTAQGPNAPGGARDYLRNGVMNDGFAIVAWPIQYGSSGVVTFLVNADGVVFQKDLGPDTAATIAKMRRFDPDLTWARVDIKD